MEPKLIGEVGGRDADGLIIMMMLRWADNCCGRDNWRGCFPFFWHWLAACLSGLWLADFP